MKEIKINVSLKVWISIILVAVLAIAGLTWIRFAITNDHRIIDGIVSGCTVVPTFLIVEYIYRRTRLVINDYSLTVKTREEWVVQFEGVDSFYVDKFNGRTFIGIRYKENTEEAIAEEEIAKERKQRSKAALQGYPYEIYVRGLSKTPQEICNLLNSRLS